MVTTDARPTDVRLEALRRSATAGRSPSGSAANRLLELLLGDSMRPGDRLPSERQLTEALGVGRSAVREALAALEVLGIVETRAGSGTYLRSATSELLPQTLSWSMLVDQERTEDLAVVRGALERAAAELAARHGDPGDIGRLRELLVAQRDAREEPDRFIDADAAFHQHIAAIARNPILTDLLATSRSLLRVWFENAVEDAADIDAAIREHTEVTEAIASGDPAVAVEAMDRHMRTATARIVRSATAS